MKRISLTALAAAAVATLSTPAWAQPAPKAAAKPDSQNQCFFSNQFEQWRDVDDKPI